MTNRSGTPTRRRKTYSPPRLVEYGEVRTLVRTGTGTQTENMTNQPAKMPSARTYKENITRIDTHQLGIGLYLYDYRAGFRDEYGHGRQLGVLAEEVETVLPGAVSTNAEGIRLVDYGLLGIRHPVR